MAATYKFVLQAAPNTVTYLGKDATGVTPFKTAGNIFPSVEGNLARQRIETFFFADIETASDPNLTAARAAAAAYLDACRLSMGYRGPPIVKDLARGAAVISNVFAAKGDLKLDDDGTTVFANCFLESAETIDDPGIHGVGIAFTFVAVAAHAAP